MKQPRESWRQRFSGLGAGDLPFQVAEADGSFEIRPAPLWILTGLVTFVLGGAFCVYTSSVLVAGSGEMLLRITIGAVPLGAAAMVLWQAAHYWRLRKAALVIEGDGRVRYGNDELVPAGSVLAVHVAPDPVGERGDYKIEIERTDGTRIELPMPYFGAISHRVTAQQLARLLAVRLGVTAVETL